MLMAMFQCLLESVNSVTQSASHCDEAHVAVFAFFELGMLKAQSAQNTTVCGRISAILDSSLCQH